MESNVVEIEKDPFSFPYPHDDHPSSPANGALFDGRFEVQGISRGVHDRTEYRTFLRHPDNLQWDFVSSS